MKDNEFEEFRRKIHEIVRLQWDYRDLSKTEFKPSRNGNETRVDKTWRAYLEASKFQTTDAPTYDEVFELLNSLLDGETLGGKSRHGHQLLFFSDGRHIAVPPERRTPPPSADKLMYLLIPRKDRDALIGDLVEDYNTNILPKFGARYALGWYWWQAVVAVACSLWTRLRGIGGLAEFVRKLIG